MCEFRTGSAIAKRPHAFPIFERAPAADRRQCDLLQLDDLPDLFGQAHLAALLSKLVLAAAQASERIFMHINRIQLFGSFRL